jgi:pimeloyl-ACP methyl ester carboxylesterase
MPSFLSDDVTIHFQDVGSGPPLVLVHGAGSSGKAFDGVLNALAADYRVLVPDLRGVGQSSRIKELGPRDYVEDQVRLLDEVGLDSAHFYGNSLGSRVVARLAVDHPERVCSIIVDSAILGLDQTGDQALDAQLSNFNDDNPDVVNWKYCHGEDWREVITTYFEHRKDPALQEYLTVRPYIAEMSTPTLICRSDIGNNISTFQQSIEWHELSLDSWLWVAPHGSGAVLRAHPQQFLVVLADFLASLG